MTKKYTGKGMILPKKALSFLRYVLYRFVNHV